MAAFRAAKIDANQPTIVDALEAVGASVQSLAGVGVGCPDLLVGREGRNYLLEVKNREGRGLKLNPDQEAWHRAWHGSVQVVSTVAEALDAIELPWRAADATPLKAVEGGTT